MKPSFAKGRYVIRLDDIAPNMCWKGYFRCKRLFERNDVRPLLGVIPDNRDPSLLEYPTGETDFWEEMRDVQARGWDIAMHGYQHVYDTKGADLMGMGIHSEFAGHDFDRQLSKLRAAKAIFDRERVSVDAFFAPSHTFDENTLRALKMIGVRSISDGYGLVPYRYSGMVFVPQLIGRAMALPLGIYTSCHHVNNFRHSDFQALEQFIERNRERILSFSEARALATDSPVNHACGATLKAVLRAKRRIGRTLDRRRSEKRYGSYSQ